MEIWAWLIDQVKLELFPIKFIVEWQFGHLLHLSYFIMFKRYNECLILSIAHQIAIHSIKIHLIVDIENFMITDVDVTLVYLDLIQKTFNIILTLFAIFLAVKFINLEIHFIVKSKVLSIWRKLELDVLRMINSDELFSFQVAGLVKGLFNICSRFKIHNVGQLLVVQ